MVLGLSDVGLGVGRSCSWWRIISNS